MSPSKRPDRRRALRVAIPAPVALLSAEPTRGDAGDTLPDMVVTARHIIEPLKDRIGGYNRPGAPDGNSVVGFHGPPRNFLRSRALHLGLF